MTSQATRLGKDGNVMARDECMPLRSDQRERLQARLIIVFSPLYIYILKSPVCSLNLNYLPSAYLFTYNCDPSRRLHIPDLRLLPLSLIKGHTLIVTYFTFVTPIIIARLQRVSLTILCCSFLTQHFKSSWRCWPQVLHNLYKYRFHFFKLDNKSRFIFL